MTALALDSLGQRQRVDRLGARIVMPGGDRGITVVAEHALVTDFSGGGRIAVVEARIQRPVAAVFGIPGERKFDQRVADIAMQITADMIARSHDVIDLPFRGVFLLTAVSDLPDSLVVGSVLRDRLEPCAGRAVKIWLGVREGLLWRE